MLAETRDKADLNPSHLVSRLILLVVLVSCSFTVRLDAQEGTIQGRVRDQQGAAVFGAVVRLLSDTTLIGITDTDRLGSFRLTGVLAGSYRLNFRAFGYAELTEDVALTGDETIEFYVRVERQAIQLEGLAVEAERSRERIRFEEAGGATVREIGLSDLKQIPGVAEADPIRAVEVLPGVVSTSDFSAAFHVRGGSQDQNLILLDGVPIFSPFHLGGFFSVFNADMLDRAELQSGGFSAEHGGRVSSVLQIESDPGDGEFGVDAGISLLASRVAVGGGASEKALNSIGLADLKWRASVRRSYFDVLLKPVFEFPYHLTDFQTVVEGWTHSGDRIVLTAYTGDDVVDLTRLELEDFPLRINWDWGNDIVGLRWTRARRGGGSLDVRANLSRYGSKLVLPDFADTNFRSEINQRQFRVDLDTRPLPALQAKVGASVEWMGYDNLLETGGSQFGGGIGSGLLTGSYAQASWSRPRKWVLETGIRLDLWHPNRGDQIRKIAPRVALKRFFNDGNVALKLAAGRYTQFLHSLRDEDLPIGLDVWVVAGDRAPPVVSDQLQLGIEGYAGQDWFWALEGYTRTFNGVVAVNGADDPNDEFDDILGGEGLSYGADLLVRKEAGTLTGWATLSFLKADRTFPDTYSPFIPQPDVTYPPIFDRRIDFDLVLRYPLPGGWDGGLRWNFGTGIPYTRPIGAHRYYLPDFLREQGLLDRDGNAVVLGGRNGSRYAPYHRLDLSFRKTFEKTWGSLVPYLDLVNVYNRKNVLFYFFDYRARPPTRSGISMFPILPTFGFEVRF